MQKQDLIHKLKDYSSMNNTSLIDLKEAIENHPYSQALQVFYLLNLRCLQDDTFDIKLPFTAICTGSRTRLKQQVDTVDAWLKSRQKEKKQQALPSKSTTINLPKRSKETFLYDNALSISERLKVQTDQPQDHRTKVVENFKKHLHNAKKHEEEAPVIEKKLKGTKKQTTKSTSKTKKSTAKVSQEEIIDKFINADPEAKIIKVKKETTPKDFIDNSLKNDLSIVSETLAEMYLGQNLINQAIAIYQKLGLIFPEKSSYFAKLIKEIKKNNNL